MYDFLIIGGGIFGLSTAVALAKKNYKVGLLNPDTIPHHLAASTDISKVVRMEYGTDATYFKMAEICMARWHDWNDLFQEKIYHEVGCLMLTKTPFEDQRNHFEKASYEQLISNGYPCTRLNGNQLKNTYPVFKENVFQEACFNPKAGFVESGLAIEKLALYARSLGVTIHENQTAEKFIIKKGQLEAVQTKENKTFQCGHVLVAAGVHTPLLIPELQPYMKITGHPVFWLKPQNPSLFSAKNFPVFFADISNSGWYGFPLSTKNGVVKLAKHTEGINMHPDQDDRQILEKEIKDLRFFLDQTIPDLVNAPLVYSRRCLYTDTLDGHFWIDHHPEIKGLSISSGGSGHAMKMGPLLGEITSAMLQNEPHPFLDRFRWRDLSNETKLEEEARFIDNRG